MPLATHGFFLDFDLATTGEWEFLDVSTSYVAHQNKKVKPGRKAKSLTGKKIPTA